MKINLKEVTADNLRSIAKLNVSSEQQNFVAPNALSVAQSKFYPSWVTLGVFDDETPVGFVMYGKDDDDGTVWIIRMMIDENLQGRGFGKQALALTIEHIKNHIECGEVFLSFVPGNETAKKLYESFGFKDTGRIEHGEIVYKLTF